MRTRIVASLVASTFVIAALGGCNSDSDEKKISRSDLERTTSNKLADQIGRRPNRVHCPQDLKAAVDESTRCELTDDGVTYGVTLTVTSVKGGDAHFNIKVDDEPKR